MFVFLIAYNLALDCDKLNKLMQNFWATSGFNALTKNDHGWLRVTPDYLRFILARPELMPIAESGPRECALHAELVDSPYRAVSIEALSQIEDADSREQQGIAHTAIQELDIHAELEERLIYPAIREEIDEEDLMNEANEEHHLVHVLIAELKKLNPSDETFKAKFTVLGELVEHHVKEEEGEMLPKAQKADIDWEELYAQVLTRKKQLMEKSA